MVCTLYVERCLQCPVPHPCFRDCVNLRSCSGEWLISLYGGGGIKEKSTDFKALEE